MTKCFLRVVLYTYMATNSICSHCCRSTPRFHCSPAASTKDHKQTGQKILQVQIKRCHRKSGSSRAYALTPEHIHSPQRLLPAADLTPLASAPRAHLSQHICSIAAGFRILSAASSSQNTPKGERASEKERSGELQSISGRKPPGLAVYSWFVQFYGE